MIKIIKIDFSGIKYFTFICFILLSVMTMRAQSHYNILWHCDKIYILQWVRCLRVNVNHLRLRENYDDGLNKKEWCPLGQIKRHHAFKIKWMVKRRKWHMASRWTALKGDRTFEGCANMNQWGGPLCSGGAGGLRELIGLLIGLSGYLNSTWCPSRSHPWHT